MKMSFICPYFYFWAGRGGEQTGNYIARDIKVVPDMRRSKDRRYYATGYDASPEERNTITDEDAKRNLQKIENGIAAKQHKSSQINW